MRSSAVQQGRVAPTRGLQGRQGLTRCNEEGSLIRGACSGNEVRCGAVRKGGSSEVLEAM
jgi:hypothetical protein